MFSRSLIMRCREIAVSESNEGSPSTGRKKASVPSGLDNPCPEKNINTSVFGFAEKLFNQFENVLSILARVAFFPYI